MIALIVTTPHLLAEDVDWKARLLAELPRAWSSVREVCAHLEGTLTAHVQDPNPPHKQSDNERISFLIKDNQVRYKRLPANKSGGEGQILGVNPHYSFALQSGASGKYSVEYIMPRGGSNEERLQLRTLTDVYGRVWAPWTSRGIPLAEWLDKPGFTILGVRPQVVGGKQLVRLEYTYTDPTPRDPRFPERFTWSGWHLLDPDDSWVIRESFLKAWHGTDSLKVEIRQRISGFPIGHRTVLAGRDRTGKRTAEYVWSTADLKLHHASDDDFTLSAFGLPEPSFAPRRIGNWPMLLVFAAGFAGLALLLRWVLKRRRAQA
jgi:hypothetical protein